jgi:cytochrome c-type biogenesis protein CcmE
MTYRINKTDGNLLAEIPDGTFDTANSSLTLIGKNVTSFGEILNENLVKLLENFSSTTAPEHPITGQVWYDTTTGRLNVFDGVNFRASGGPLISPSRPNNLVPGDLWINNETNQLFFYDGAGAPILAGPLYTEQQKKSGFIVESIIDTSNRLKVIVKLFVSDTLIGIFSNSAFTPALPIEGFSGSIGIGFTVSSATGTKFDVTATRAESLITGQNQVKVADDILFNNEDGTIVGSLKIQSVDGLQLLGGDPGTDTSAQGDTSLKLEGGNFIIENNESSRAIEVRTKKPIGGTTTAIYIDAVNQRVGFFNTAPSSTVDITGDLRVNGNLIIEGNSFEINTTTLKVQDKNIEMNVTESGIVSDVDANGGGFTLYGTTPKTIQYSSSQQAWSSSEHFDLSSNKYFSINGIPVLTNSALGSSVTTAQGLTTIESVLQYLNIDNVSINGNTISSTTGDLILDTADKINFNDNLLTGVQDINYDTSQPDAAANKKYVDDRVLTRPLTLSIDISDFNVISQLGMEAANNKIVEILTYTASIFDLTNNPQGVSVEGTFAKVLAAHSSVTLAPIQYQPVQTGTALTGTETIAFQKTDATYSGSGFSNTISVVSDIVSIQTIPSPAATITVQRFYKRFEVIEQPDNSLAWEYVTDFVPRGTWNNLTAYTANDLVLYDNKEWICIISVGTGGTNPAADVTNWKLFANI